jgi:UDP-N-acetylglucosamine/UDP-N-acetylgalactosamine diphosphorylase
MNMASSSHSLADLHARLKPFGQEHVLRWWTELSAAEQAKLADQIQQIDMPSLRALAEKRAESAHRWTTEEVLPAPVLTLPQTVPERLAERRAHDRGEAALRAGHVAVLVVAGGQGSRLGFDGPKGAFPIGPVSGATLFQILCEKVLAIRRRYDGSLPLLLMTSEQNDSQTREFFAKHDHFGLPASEVTFFPQGTMPAIDAGTGKLLLSAKGELAVSPDGHGGLLAALVRHQILKQLKQRGVRWLFYCQVDNPLLRVADATYLGQHIEAGADMSLKVVEKNGPREAVGNVVRRHGRLQIIEYSELPDALAEPRDASGRLAIWAGSTAIHVFSIPFLERLAADPELLPFHVALKKVPFIDAAGDPVTPNAPNALKFEKFIFDALPLAANALAVETRRTDEFEPLKNTTGEYSPRTVRQAMIRLHAEWLGQAGVEVPRDSAGQPIFPAEISPRYADSAEELCRKSPHMSRIAKPVYLSE